MLSFVTELLWALRREGFTIAPPQAIAAVRTVTLLGFEDLDALVGGLAAVLCTRRSELALFERVVRRHASTHRGHPGDLFDRLRGRGVLPEEIDALRQLLEAAASRSGQAGGEGSLPRALAGTSDELEWLLRAARLRRVTAGLASSRTLGFFSEAASRELGLPQAASALARAGAVLEEAFGKERGAVLTGLLREELEGVKRRIRLELGRVARERNALVRGDAPESGLDVAFQELDEEEAREVRQAVRRLAQQLGGGASARERRAKRGRVDLRRTLRASFATGGVPFARLRRRRRRDRPKLVVLCDVSDSVRAASRFLLELVSSLSVLVASVRSFVFVSELCETSELFARLRAGGALAAIASGAVVHLGGGSNYGRVLAQLERDVGQAIDRRTTLLVLGDGRSSQRDDGLPALASLRARARAVIWICPEPREVWGLGDSRMPAYATAVDRALVARTARELTEAARTVIRLC